MEFEKEYFQRKREKKILDNNLDLPIAIIAHDLAFGKIASDYKDFLYGSNVDEGFISGYNELRKKAVDQVLRFHEKYIRNQDASAFDIDQLASRGRDKNLYWKTKDFVVKESNNPTIYGDNEELIKYEVGETAGIEVHHLKRLKSFVNEEPSLEQVKYAIDPKYKVAMTVKGHRSGEEIGHAGNTSNDPQISDPKNIEGSTQNEYYELLKEKREQLIDVDLDEWGQNIGIASILLLLVLSRNKENSHFLLNRFQNEKIKRILIGIGAFGVGMKVRESVRDEILESNFVQDLLYNLRDEALEINAKHSNILDPEDLDFLGDIDLFGDVFSLPGISIFMQGTSFYLDYQNKGYIDKQLVYKHGQSLATRTAIFGGGKLVVSAFIDPSGASMVVFISYVGYTSINFYLSKAKDERIRSEHENQMERVINIQLQALK